MKDIRRPRMGRKEKEMINVLIKHQRNKGEFEAKPGEKLAYDNVVLVVGRLDPYGLGLSISPDKNKDEREYKIPYEKFEEVVGYKYEDFVSVFETSFFGHEINCLGGLNFGRFIVQKVEIFEEAYISFTEAALKEFDENRRKLVQISK